MTDETAKKQAELESDEEDEQGVPARPGALFRDVSSSPELPPLKRSKNANGSSATTKAQASQRDDDGTETEASDASTEVYSDSDLLVRQCVLTPY